MDAAPPVSGALPPETQQKGDDLFMVVEELPEFPGGANALMHGSLKTRKIWGQGLMKK